MLNIQLIFLEFLNISISLRKEFNKCIRNKNIEEWNQMKPTIKVYTSSYILRLSLDMVSNPTYYKFHVKVCYIMFKVDIMCFVIFFSNIDKLVFLIQLSCGTINLQLAYRIWQHWNIQIMLLKMNENFLYASMWS